MPGQRLPGPGLLGAGLRVAYKVKRQKKSPGREAGAFSVGFGIRLSEILPINRGDGLPLTHPASVSLRE